MIGALVVVLCAIAGGTYFYLQAKSPVTVVCATRDIPNGTVIRAEFIEETKIRKGDIPDWIKSHQEADSTAVYMNSNKELVGGRSAGITTGQMIYKGGMAKSAAGVFEGCDLIHHK